MAEAGANFSGGFTDPPIEAAEAFRAILKAMSRPGVGVPLAARVSPPEPLRAETAAVLLTLADAETPLWIAPELASGEVLSWLRFHTGAPVVAEPAMAMFAVVGPRTGEAALTALSIGTAEYPERSATVVLQLERSLAGPSLRLSGPGIETEARLDAAALPASVLSILARNRALYPLGLDLVVAGSAEVTCIPRSSLVEPTGAA